MPYSHDVNRLRLLAVIVAVLVVIGAVVSRIGGGGDAPTAANSGSVSVPTIPNGTAPADAIEVSIAYSPEKEALLNESIARFNERGEKIDGRPIFVTATNVSSGAALERIKAGSLQPTIWTPSSSLWGRLLTEQKDVTWVPAENASLVRTPLVIAIWKDQAEALGWPAKELGWSDVLREAQNEQGWAAYGHPEWGAFKLGHTNPDFSTSGLSAVAAEYYAATGKTEGLRLADVEDPAVRSQVQAIQSSIVHYGDTTLFFADQMVERGPAYASAVAMEETTLLDANKKLAEAGSKRTLVAIYPKEGTFFSDNPLIVMKAPWVSAEQAAAAERVTAFLREPETQKQVGQYGFRPALSDVPVSTDLNTSVGVDPAQPTRLLSLPEPKVLARIKELWREDRKPADVVLVVDVSGSMGDENKLAQAQEGLVGFLGQISPRDRVALVVFADRSQVVQPLAEMNAANRQELETAITGLFAEGGTALYDATIDGLDLLQSDADPKHIQAVVVLSDGEDTRSNATIESLTRELEKRSETGSQRVFTIAYGVDANSEALKTIAETTGGKAYSGNPDTIASVYTSISSFF